MKQIYREVQNKIIVAAQQWVGAKHFVEEKEEEEN